MSAPPGAVNAYYLPQPSRWPITGACALLLTAVGAATWINRAVAGPYILAAGMALLAYMLFGWFGTVIRESEAGLYNKQVEWRDVRSAKMIGVPYLGAVFPPRLVVRSGIAFTTFNGGSRDVLVEFAKISLAFQMKK